MLLLRQRYQNEPLTNKNAALESRMANLFFTPHPPEQEIFLTPKIEHKRNDRSDHSAPARNRSAWDEWANYAWDPHRISYYPSTLPYKEQNLPHGSKEDWRNCWNFFNINCTQLEQEKIYCVPSKRIEPCIFPHLHQQENLVDASWCSYLQVGDGTATGTLHEPPFHVNSLSDSKPVIGMTLCARTHRIQPQPRTNITADQSPGKIR